MPRRFPHPAARCAARWRRALMCVGVAAALLWPLQAADVRKESDVKAALLYNFTQFVEWPATAFASEDEPLVIGVLGRDPFAGVLAELVEHEAVGGHRIVVTHYRSPEAARAAHVLFISSSERSNLARILPVLDGRPILTVADFDGFLDRGGMVALQRSNDQKMRVRVNLAAARAASLTLSAKLLRVVDIVSTAGEH